MRCIGLNRVKLNTREGCEELIKKIKVLRSHHYSNEEIIVDLGLTESELNMLDQIDAFNDSLV